MTGLNANDTRTLALSLAFIAFVILSAAFVVSPFHEVAGDQSEGMSGDGLIWSYDEHSKTLTIDGTGAIPDFDIIGDGAPWAVYGGEAEIIDIPLANRVGGFSFFLFEAVTEVRMPNVVSIGEYAFAYCYNLTLLDLSSVKTIEKYAFCGCESIKALDMPKMETIGDFAFRDSLAIEKIVAPKLDYVGAFAIGDIQSIKYVEAYNLSAMDLIPANLLEHPLRAFLDGIFVLDVMTEMPRAEGYMIPAIEVVYDSSKVKGVQDFGVKYFTREADVPLPQVVSESGNQCGWGYNGLIFMDSKLSNSYIGSQHVVLTLKEFAGPPGDNQGSKPVYDIEATLWYVVLAIVFLPIIATFILAPRYKH